MCAYLLRLANSGALDHQVVKPPLSSQLAHLDYEVLAQSAAYAAVLRALLRISDIDTLLVVLTAHCATVTSLF